MIDHLDSCKCQIVGVSLGISAVYMISGLGIETKIGRTQTESMIIILKKEQDPKVTSRKTKPQRYSRKPGRVKPYQL